MSITLEGLTKRYGGQPVVNHVTLEVGEGEFFVLLGSSGSGKTTILNLIAGLSEVDGGRILLKGRDVTYLPPQQRRVGFVFQNYALFQYMTVAENIEFGLRVRKMRAPERARRRDELLELVGLAGLGNRMPRQLSGGQQQRVALARALASEPDVLLLDEPLGALDARIRVELRRSLKEVQRKLGIAAILVTHDQEEAFDLADRIGVMSFGRLLEVGAPRELYQRPQTEFVASFLGTANLLLGNAKDGCAQVGPVRFPLEEEIPQLRNDNRVQVLFRPEDVALSPTEEGLECPSLGQAEVEAVSFSGSFERLRLRLPPIPGVRPISPPVSFGSRTILLDATRSPEQAARFPLLPGDQAWVGVHRIHALSHPGLSFLIVTDGSLSAQAALDLGGQIARMAHARVTLLGCGPQREQLEAHLQEARKSLGSGLAGLETLTLPGTAVQAVARAVERNPVDLVIMGFQPSNGLAEAERILQAGDHHLLLAQGSQSAPPDSAVICVASGEPGKDDILFAGRLIRHLYAEATLLSVVAEGQDESELQRTERFLEGGVQSLSVLGVPATSKIRRGPVADEIVSEVKGGDYDLLVLGAPLMEPSGRISLGGVVGDVLHQVTDRAVLIVRSHFIGARFSLQIGAESGRFFQDAGR